MPESTTSASLKTLFKFPLQGEGWQGRFAAGSGLMLAGMFIPILPLVFVFGYAVRVMRRVIEGEAPTLPAWDDWGSLGADGLRAGLVGLLYLLPGMLVYGGGTALYTGGAVLVQTLMTASQDSGQVMLGMLFLFANIALLMFALCIGTLLWVLGAVPLPLAIAHMVSRDELGAAFRVGEWWCILRANKAAFFVDWVIVAGLGAILYLGYILLYYSVVLCCVVPLLTAPASFYLLLVGAAKFAQSYREATLPSRKPSPARPRLAQSGRARSAG